MASPPTATTPLQLRVALLPIRTASPGRSSPALQPASSGGSNASSEPEHTLLPQTGPCETVSRDDHDQEDPTRRRHRFGPCSDRWLGGRPPNEGSRARDPDL